MGKYEPLTRYLEALEADSWEPHFSDIERILGFKLPESASQYQAWWANQTGAGHSQTRGWQDAGFETRHLNLDERKVRFERVREIPGRANTGSEIDQDLWSQAMNISGIRDRGKLVEAALLALIQREAGKRLIALGGSMPDAKAPARKRFD